MAVSCCDSTVTRSGSAVTRIERPFSSAHVCACAHALMYVLIMLGAANVDLDSIDNRNVPRKELTNTKNLATMELLIRSEV